jgi:hypothetical protein
MYRVIQTYILVCRYIQEQRYGRYMQKMHVCIRDVLHHWPAQANKYYVYFLSSYIYHIYPRAAVFVSETFFNKR